MLQLNAVAVDGPSRPLTIREFLRRGLVEADARNFQEWRHEHERILVGGGDTTKADLALSLILARAGRYDHMTDILLKTQEREPTHLVVLRLLSWAQLSDGNFLDGLETIDKLAEQALRQGISQAAFQQSDIIRYAANACGFADVATKELAPDQHEAFQAIRNTILSRMTPATRGFFLANEEEMRENVRDGLIDTLESRSHASEQQVAEKNAKKEDLETSQRHLEIEARIRHEQAAEIERTATQRLLELKRQAAPLFLMQGVIIAELDTLRHQRSRQSDEQEKEHYDPQIASAEGRLAGINQLLNPLIAEYNQVEQTAIRSIQAIGMRVRNLNGIHNANVIRLRQNESKPTDGLTGKIAGKLRRQTRLATYLPLNFEMEANGVMSATFSSSSKLD